MNTHTQAITADPCRVQAVLRGPDAGGQVVDSVQPAGIHGYPPCPSRRANAGNVTVYTSAQS